MALLNKQQLREIFLESDTRPVGLLLAGIMLVWGIVLLNPLTLTFLVSPVYRPMYSFFPTVELAELVWGTAYTIAGLATLVGVLKPNSITHQVLLLGIMLFTFTSITLGRGTPGSIGPWLHLLFDAALIWKYLRLWLVRN